MTGDPFIDELRRYRDDFAARFNYDVDAIGRELEERFARQSRLLSELASVTEGIGAAGPPCEPARRDPIIDEIRRYRDEHAARFNNNVRAIGEDMRKRYVEP